MVNLTITVDDETLRKARMRALERGTSVNSVVRDFLESYTGTRRGRERAVRDLLTLSEQSGSRRAGRTWSRDELHERGG